MIVAYSSLTGNTERFAQKLNIPTIRIGNQFLSEDFILLTYTIGKGEVPKDVQEFLNYNHQLLRGVAASGNRNWGKNFGKAAYTISQQYDVPIIHIFEIAGTKQDVSIFKTRKKELYGE